MVLHSHRWEDLLEVWVRQRERDTRNKPQRQAEGHGRTDSKKGTEKDSRKGKERQQEERKKEDKEKGKQKRKNGEQREANRDKWLKMMDRIKWGWKKKMETEARGGRNKDGRECEDFN